MKIIKFQIPYTVNSNLISIIISLTLFILLTSCEDVINLNLKNASPQMVIQGNISNLTDSVVILLNKTTDYFNPSPNTAVTSAQVSISDNAGNIYPLTEIASGVYYNGHIAGTSGTKYTLKVDDGETVFTSSSQMPDLVKIDSMSVENTADFRNENAIDCFIHDPAGVPNYYMAKVIKNGVLLKPDRITVTSDKFFDGKSRQFVLDAGRYGLDRFLPNDTLTVQLFNIDKPTYDYFNTLRDVINNDGLFSSSTPANPTGNISNGALGYFAAWSVSEKTIVVP